VFHDLKTKGLFFDVVLNTKDGYSFPAHRIILCTCGEYFRTLFSGRWKSSNNSEIHIPGVTGVVLNQILNFAYKREVKLLAFSDGAKELLVVADHLGIDEIATKCIRFINEQTDSGNCIDIWNFARKYNCSVLVDNSLSFIHKNIINVALHRPINGRCAYAELSLDDMKSLLQHNELNVATEYLEFFLVVRWVRGNPSERIRVMDKLLKCIRLGTMGLEFLERVAVRHEYRSHKSYCGIHPTDVPDDAERTGMPEIFHQVCEPRFPQSLLLVVGGWSNESPTQSAEIYQPKMNKWMPAEECFPTLLRKPRAYHAILYDDGWIYVIGGFDGETTFNGCDRFNIFNGKWQKMCGMINRRCYVGIALLQGEIYAVGGKNGEQEGDRLKSAEKFNPNLNTWTKLPDMIERRSDAGVCSLHDRVYVAGGFTGFQCVSSVEYFDLGLKQWNRVAPMRVPRSGLSTVAYKDFLVVLGGFDGRDRLRTVEVFYPKKNRWTVLESMSVSRSALSCCVIENL
uniref:BTB domain-containing protein n=1 Tax=Ciona savignyi TaxID=51511 RepID=H2Y8L9_CIOSA